MRHLAFLLVVLFTAALSLPAQAQTEDEDRGYLQALLEDNLSGAGRNVRIVGFSGALSSVATIEELTIADDEGIWITVRNIELDWSRAALLRGRVEVNKLTASEIILPRLPTASSTTPDMPDPEATPFSLPDLPVSIRIDELAIDRVELGEAVMGTAVDFSAAGSAELADGQGTASLSVDRLDGAAGELSFTGSYANDTSTLALDLSLTEASGGIVATLLNLPDSPAIALTLQGEGPLDDFAADIALATDGQDRLTGNLTLAALQDAANPGRAFTAALSGDIRPLMQPDQRAFFGPDLSLNVAGQTYDSGRLAVDTLAFSTDALTLNGQIALDANKWPERIDLTGRIAAPTGGPVLVSLVGNDTRVETVDLNVQFDAAAGDAWTADFVVDQLSRPDIAMSQVRLNGSGSLIQGDGNTVGQVQGQFDMAATGILPLDPGLARALGDRITGLVTFDWQKGTPLNLTEITVNGDGFGLDGAISVGGLETDPSPDITGNLQLRADDISRFSGLAGRDLGGSVDLRVIGTTAPLDGSFDATISGTATDLVTGVTQADGLLDGTTNLSIDAARNEDGIALRAFSLDAPGLQATANGTLATGGSQAQFDITVPETQRAVPQLRGQTRVTGQARQTGNSWVVDADASAPGGVVFDGTATVALIEGVLGQISGTGTLKADNLGLYSELAQRDLAGGLDIAGSGSFDPATQNFSADLSGTSTNLQVAIPQVDGLMQGRATFTVDADRDATGIELRTLTLDTPRITATAGATLRTTNSSARFDISVQNLADVLPDLDGAAQITGTATQNADAWDIDVEGTGPGGAAVDALAKVTYTYDDIANILNGTLGPISGEGTLSADSLAPYAGVAGRDLGGAVSVTGSGSFDPDSQNFEVTATGSATDLRVGIVQADNLLAGASTFTVDATRDDTGILLRDARINGQQITASAEGIYRDQASAARFDVVLTDLADVLPQMAGSGGARLSGSVDQQGDAFAFNATGSGPGNLSIDATGSVAYADGTLGEISGQGTIDAGDLSAYSGVAGQRLGGSLNASGSGSFNPANASFSADVTATADNLRTGIAQVDQITAGRSTLRVNARREADSTIVVETLNLATPQLTATADGRLSPAGGANLRYDARLANLGIFVDGFNGPVTANGTASSDGGDYRIDADLTGPGGTNARVAGTVAPDASRANITATGSAPLALANQFTQPNILAGTARFDLRLNGPLALDSLTGTISTAGSEVVIANQPIDLTNINADIALTGGAAQIDLTTDVSSGGSITVNGPVTLSAPFNGDLAIVLRRVGISQPGLVETEVSGQLGLNGALTRDARLSGTLNFEQMEIRIPDTGLGATGIDFTIKHVNEPADVRRTRDRAGLVETDAANAGPGIAYPLDLTINAPSRIFVRGRGLDAELGGTLRLGGTTANVIPQGQFDLIRGRLDILGQRLDLSTASIFLQGDFDPFITVVAITSRAETTITFRIEGPVSDPEVTISSSPDRPEEEVLALLLFGRDVTEISPFQAVRIAAAVNTLVGRGGTGIVDRLRMGFGLDDFDVQTAADGSTELRFGKYIGENLYTDVAVDSGGDTAVNLNFDITPNITARGSVGSDGNTGLGVFFEKDY